MIRAALLCLALASCARGACEGIPVPRYDDAFDAHLKAELAPLKPADPLSVVAFDYRAMRADVGRCKAAAAR